jgi:hypothetical protein
MAAMLALAGCGGDDGGSGGGDGGGDDRGGSRDGIVAELDVRDEVEGEVPDVSASQVEDGSLATLEWQAAGDPTVTVRADVLVIRADERLATAWVAFTARAEEERDGDEPPTLFELLGDRSMAPRLWSLEQPVRQHAVVGAGRPVQGPGSVDIDFELEPDQPRLAYFTFAAPPEDVDQVDLRLAETVPGFLDVPLER